MADRPDPDRPATTPPSPDPSPADTARAERDARLAAALRENLKRRKAQARERHAARGDGKGSDPKP